MILVPQKFSSAGFDMVFMQGCVGLYSTYVTMLVRVVALACSGLKEAPCRLQVLPHRGVPINGVVVKVPRTGVLQVLPHRGVPISGVVVKVPRAGVRVFMCLPRAGVAVVVLLARAWAVWCCPPRWGWLGQSLLPCDLLAGDWAGFCCPRPPRWGWLGCVSVPSVSSLEIGRVVAARCSPRWSLDRSLLQLFSSLEPGRFVEEVVLAGVVWVDRCRPLFSSIYI